MCLENIDPHLILAMVETGAIIILVLVTWWYAKNTKKMLEEMQIDRKIQLIEKKLEKLYLPLKRNFKYVEWKPDISTTTHRQIEIASFEKFWDEINKYSYLARKELDPLLAVILKGVSASFTEVKEKEIFNITKIDFEKVIDNDIVFYRKQLDKLID